MTRLAGPRHDVEAPEELSRLRLVADGTTVQEVVAERHDADDDAVAVRGSGGHPLRRNLFRVLGGPDDLAGFLADRHHVRVAEAGKQQPVADADAPLAAERHLGFEGPERRARRRIERHDDAGGRDDEHASVFDHRGGFGPVRRFHNPGAAQLFDVPCVDLSESGVAGARTIAGRRAPILPGIRLSLSGRPHGHDGRENQRAQGHGTVPPTTASHQHLLLSRSPQSTTLASGIPLNRHPIAAAVLEVEYRRREEKSLHGTSLRVGGRRV